VRIVPSGQTTIARIDIWADPRTGLPLRVDVIAKGARTAALTTRFLDVRLQRPSVAVTTFRPPPDADVDETTAPDLVSAIDRSSPYQLPDTIAGIRQRPRVQGLHGGAATYGDGYTIVAVLPISDGLAYGTIDRLTRTPTGLPGVAASTAAWVLTPLTSTLVVTAPNGNYLLTGTVPLSLLETMARALEAGPLPFREGSGP
jgi:hypothetical protein